MSISWLIHRNVPAYESDSAAVKWLARRIIKTGNIRAPDGPNRAQRKKLYGQAIEAQKRQRDLFVGVATGYLR